ncbi:response regulator [Agromyces sp. Q22]|uniref:Response regulator n=1 Tax=Agromyces kandeliae TaxID=2666141 RepID=A0A6L5QY24_9MICO|nr:response regulator [Agromyces kandeliae]
MLVVDDHPVFRDGLVGAFATVPEVEVCGTAGDGQDAVRESERLRPDVVLMDLNLPTMSGVEATRAIVDAGPGVAVLVLTMLDDPDSVFAALRAGARGYLLKGSRPEEIVSAVLAAGQGEAVFGPGIADRVLAYFSATRARSRPVPFPELTDREREILELIASGERNTDIARRLYISPKTVRNHVSNIFSKLHVADRAEAIALARDAGVGSAATEGRDPRPRADPDPAAPPTAPAE